MNALKLSFDSEVVDEYLDEVEEDRSFVMENGLGFILEMMSRVVCESPRSFEEIVDRMLALAPGIDRSFFKQLLVLLIGNKQGRHLFRRNIFGHIHPLTEVD